MNHQELKDLLPLYVLGGLDAESVAEVERHLAELCHSCLAEVHEWREVIGLIPLGVMPLEPSTVVKERLMARVRQDLGEQVIPLRSRRRRVFWMAAPLATAAAVLIVIGGLRYQAAVKLAAEQATRAGAEVTRVETVAALLAQAQNQLAEREAELRQLTSRLEEQQAAAAEKTRLVAQLETTLAEQRQLVNLRDQELARLQQNLGTEGKTVVAQYEREIASLKADLSRQHALVNSSERELHELRLTLAQQRALAETSVQEAARLRDALSRQRGAVEVLTAPGLRIGYLHQGKRNMPTKGHVLWNERKKAWLFYVFGMPQPPAGKEYQVWFMTDKEGPVSAGVFTPDANGTGWVLATSPSKLFGDIKAAAVTLEPAGGLPKPSGETYLRGTL
jgi:anti-sigma-K factor RskA